MSRPQTPEEERARTSRILGLIAALSDASQFAMEDAERILEKALADIRAATAADPRGPA